MKFLLDTHALVWWLHGHQALSRAAREAIMNPEAVVCHSAVSAYEMANKLRLGKWPEVRTLVADFGSIERLDGLKLVDLTATHAVLAGSLPSDHRDPFDRLIAAQGMVEGAVIISADPAIRMLGAPVLW